MRKRGRPSNWDGIAWEIGRQNYQALVAVGRITGPAATEIPDRDKLIRFAEALLGATGNAKDRAEKREKEEVLRKTKRSHIARTGGKAHAAQVAGR